MNALSPVTLLASTNLTPAGSDAELIRVCDAHAAKIDAANALVGDGDDHPAQRAYDQSYEFISNTRAVTLGGIVAKARAAKAEAVRGCASGEDYWSGGPAGDWAADVTNELLRLFGHAPDAELIAVCAEFDACERQTCIIHGSGPDCVVDDDEANVVSAPIFARMHVLLDLMNEMRATTPAGIQARAHCLAQHAGHGGYSFDYKDTMAGRLLAYLMRDSAALGGSVGTVPTPPSSDAELLQTCAAFDALERDYLATGFGYEFGSAEEAAADAERDRIQALQHPLVARMCELQAVTRDGMAARAHSLALWDAELLKDAEGGTGARLSAAIVRDLLAGRSVA